MNLTLSGSASINNYDVLSTGNSHGFFNNISLPPPVTHTHQPKVVELNTFLYNLFNTFLELGSFVEINFITSEVGRL